jgi:diguanylate cyclase (GGDEF)-like protein
MQANLYKANSALAHEARHDSLTGIMNRRSLMENLSREIARDRRQHNGLTIGMCDIDNFKKINDLHGHMVGDEVLCGVVRLLEKCLRQFDSLGRFGGEEFVLITPGVQRSDAYVLYERFRIMVADNQIKTNAGNISVTISIGVAVYNGNGKLEELLNEADTSLYEAKRKGRNQVCLAHGLFDE